MPDPALLALEKVEALLRAAENRGFGLFEYQEGGMHLRVTFSDAGASQPTVQASPSLPAQAAPHPAARAKGEDKIVSPGVGFFRCSHPAAGRLAEEGVSVAAGAVLALIQAGPLLQPVSAPRDGRLGKQLVAEGAAVAFGTALFEFA